MESKKILHNKQGCYKIKKANGYEMGDNNMFQKFYPAEDIGSTYDINFEEYFDKGYRGVIFDVDNTLVRHNMPADVLSFSLYGFHAKDLVARSSYYIGYKGGVGGIFHIYVGRFFGKVDFCVKTVSAVEGVFHPGGAVFACHSSDSDLLMTWIVFYVAVLRLYFLHLVLAGSAASAGKFFHIAFH